MQSNGSGEGREPEWAVSDEKWLESHLGSGPEAPRIGIALSGGGIRSATFNLGILSVLRKKGILKHVHFLSTVSGGGYIASWLVGNTLNVPKFLEKEADWSAPIGHLRKYSNCLSPKVGFFSADTWTMFMIWLRNTMLIQLSLLTVLLLPLLGVRFLPLSLPPEAPADGGSATTQAATVSVTTALELSDGGGADTAQPAPLAGRTSMTLSAGDGTVSKGPSTATVTTALALPGGGSTNKHPSTATATTSLTLRSGDRPANAQQSKSLAPACQALPAVGNLATVVCKSVRWAEPALLPVGQMLVGVGRWLLPRASVSAAIGCVLFLLSFLVASVSMVCGLRKAGAQGTCMSQTKVQWLIVIPLVVSAFALLPVMWRYAPEAGNEFTHGLCFVLGNAARSRVLLVLGCGVVFLAILGIALCALRRSTSKWRWVGIAALSAIVAALALLLLTVRLLTWMPNAGGLTTIGPDWWPYLATAFMPPAILFAFSLAAVLHIGIAGLMMDDSAREWWSRLGAWLGIYGLGVTTVCALAFFSGWLFMRLEAWHGWSALGTWVLSTGGSLFAAHSSRTDGNGNRGNKVLEVVAAVGPYVFIAGLLILVSAGTQMGLSAFAGSDADWTNPSKIPWCHVGGRYLSVLSLRRCWPGGWTRMSSA